MIFFVKNFPIYVPCLFLMAYLTACNDSGNRRKKDDDRPTRSGIELKIEDLVHFDSNASIAQNSQNEVHVVFISGRDGSLKTYKYVAGEGQTSERLSDEDFGQEAEAVLSPDGTLVAVVGFSGEGNHIYLAQFDDGSQFTQLDEESNAVGSLRFSPDSRYFSYVSRNPETGLRMVKVVKVENNIPNQPVVLTDESVDEFSPVWISSASDQNYRLIVQRRAIDGFLSKIIMRTFASDVSQAVESEVDLEDRFLLPDIIPVGRDSGFYGVVENRVSLPGHKEPIAATGEFDMEKKVEVENFGSFFDIGEAGVSDVDSYGFGVQSIGSNQSGDFGIWVVRDVFSCEENKFSYGSTLMLYTPAQSTKIARYIPQTNPDKESLSPWITTSDPCQTKVEFDEETGDVELDKLIMNVGLTKESTVSNFSAVYVTYFSKDTEVRLVLRRSEAGVTTDTFYNVSDN